MTTAAGRRRLVEVALGTWFAVSCAAYAGFIDLPRLPRWLATAMFWMSAAGNAMWYGFVRPRLALSRTARANSLGNGEALPPQ